MENSHLINLPVEILHHIFHYCDVRTIAFKIGRVCKRLRTVAYRYSRFQLTFHYGDNAMFIEHMLHLIPNDSIVSLILTDLYTKFQAFLDIVHKSNVIFTRIRHLTLNNVRDDALENFFANINYIQPISLTIDSHWPPKSANLSKFSTWIMNTNLQKLCWKQLDYNTNDMSWVDQCKLTHLTINSCLYSEYRILLHRLPYLKTLQLNNCTMDTEDMCIPSSIVSFDSQLTYLIINDCLVPVECLMFLISKIPQLRHLKLVSYAKMIQSVADIYQWEKFIRTEMNFLHTCEFLVSYEMSSDDVVSLPSLLAPFQEPFWVHEKRWFIVCEYELGFSTISLHTTSMDNTERALPRWQHDWR
ncbi:unnamed protein product [Rotaria sp. Silwood2]|nr:unnamed protein product [Rotaria sp. Silwood2]CAF4371558.1 unnamed protein product [Rotaria sp. Silwood2]CAF4430250.1 unnamed protein product [Rotaria sp. Silwood2]